MGSSFTNGANFAVGGGKTFPRFDFFNLGLQSVQFFWFQNQSIELTSKGMASNYIFIYLLLLLYIYIKIIITHVINILLRLQGFCERRGLQEGTLYGGYWTE